MELHKTHMHLIEKFMVALFNKYCVRPYGNRRGQTDYKKQQVIILAFKELTAQRTQISLMRKHNVI